MGDNCPLCVAAGTLRQYMVGEWLATAVCSSFCQALCHSDATVTYDSRVHYSVNGSRSMGQAESHSYDLNQSRCNNTDLQARTG